MDGARYLTYMHSILLHCSWPFLLASMCYIACMLYICFIASSLNIIGGLKHVHNLVSTMVTASKYKVCSRRNQIFIVSVHSWSTKSRGSIKIHTILTNFYPWKYSKSPYSVNSYHIRQYFWGETLTDFAVVQSLWLCWLAI